MTAYARPETLVDADWLASHLEDPNLRLVEVDVSTRAHDGGHLPGAVLWNVYQDLKDGDYRLVDRAALGRLIARSGIHRDSTVVFYGYAPALGFWLMKLYGHPDVRVLDCSRDAWRAEGRPWTTATSAPAAGGYDLDDEDPRIRANSEAMREAIGRPGALILDVRSAAEYEGERFWPSGGLQPDGRAGHVPSALHQPIDGLYDERGAFREASDLRGLFSSVDLDRAEELITYCTIGGRAATAWFALSCLLGHGRVRVYDGSWAEWGRLADVPVATGSERT